MLKPDYEECFDNPKDGLHYIAYYNKAFTTEEMKQLQKDLNESRQQGNMCK